MSTKAERGTKRTCQNPECGSRFYDLNRDPIVCPVCEHRLRAGACRPMAMSRRPPRRRPPRKPAKKPAFVPPEAPSPRTRRRPRARTLAVIEGEEEEAAAGAEDDETFLEEEEEDGSDMTGIIGGPVDDKDEAT